MRKLFIFLSVVFLLVGCVQEENLLGGDSSKENKTEVTGEIVKEVEEGHFRVENYTLANGESVFFEDKFIRVAVFPKHAVFNVGGNVLSKLEEGEEIDYEGLKLKVEDIFEKKRPGIIANDNVEFTLTYISEEFGKFKEGDKLDEGSEKTYSFPDRDIELEVKIISSEENEPFAVFYVEKDLTKKLFDGDGAYFSDNLRVFVTDVEDNEEPVSTYFVSFKVSTS